MLHNLTCAKCGRCDEWVMASVDLNDGICINCSDLFDEWCDTHIDEPFQNFIHPKPWEPKNPGFVILTLEGGETWAYCPPTYDIEEYFELPELTPAEKLVGPLMPECF